MKTKIKILLILNVILSIDSFSQVTFKVIKLNKNEIFLNVPAEWKVKENAMRFAVYEIKYDVEAKNPKNSSGVALYVYDSLYGPKMQITDSIVAERREEKLSDPNRKVQITDYGKKEINAITIGYLKYTFQLNKKGIRVYGIDMFFCDKRNVYNKIEIIGLNQPIEEFKKIAERVFESIVIK